MSRSNGAWLISWLGSLTEDATPDQLYEAESSIKVAKRVAREGAAEFGYVGAPRWELRGAGYWALEMAVDLDEWRAAG